MYCLGSEEEIEEYSQLPPEEAKRKLGELFLRMDVDGNSYLDKDELSKWILKSFM